jgi:hypothetical protein
MTAHFADLASGEQKGANAVVVARRCFEWLRLGASLLDAAQAAVGIDTMDETGPCLLNHGAISLLVEQAFVDSRGERKGDECRAGDFRKIVGIGIEEACTPKAVGPSLATAGCILRVRGRPGADIEVCE